jgi:hypothetical protein
MKTQSNQSIPSIKTEHPNVILAQLDAETSTTFDSSDGVVVSCSVSTYLESDGGPGSFAVELTTEQATVTTCVTLEICSEFSLRMTAFDAAQRLLGGQLALARRCASISQASYTASGPTLKAKSEVQEPSHSKRDSFFVSAVRRDGPPDFDTCSFNVMKDLTNSAAFADFAFHTER